jgi:maleate isomerase
MVADAKCNAIVWSGTAVSRLGETNNFAFAEVDETTIGGMIEAVAASKPDASTIMCKNMRRARIAPAFEERLGIPIVESTSAAAWAGLRLAGVDTRKVKGWGRLFAIGQADVTLWIARTSSANSRFRPGFKP